MTWREVWEENRQEIVADFRQFFQISAYSVPHTITLDEAYNLLKSLTKMTNSRLYGKLGKIEPLTLEEILLMRVHNAIVASIPSKETAKKKRMMIEIPQPQSKNDKKKMTGKTAKEFFAHVKVKEV